MRSFRGIMFYLNSVKMFKFLKDIMLNYYNVLFSY